MRVVAFEGIVEDGQIRLERGARIPDGTKVYVVAPDIRIVGTAEIVSPRLKSRADASRFALEVVEADAGAGGTTKS